MLVSFASTDDFIFLWYPVIYMGRRSQEHQIAGKAGLDTLRVGTVISRIAGSIARMFVICKVGIILASLLVG